MNEITNIHLGRQPFTIAVDAHRALRAYLHAIGEHVGKDVLEEIELRMAELLAERGIGGDKKVVIMADVEFLKEQLGEPADFHDDAKDDSETGNATHAKKSGKAEEGPRRLYRDTDNAMVAGVSSGLAAYFGIDPIIVRLIFVVLILSGGTGILLYLLLWLLVPEAKTESDRLQMKGKPVTVENIKAAVDQADVQGAANRAAKVAEKVFAAAGKILLAIIGVGFVLAGIAILLGAATAASFALVRGFELGGQLIFPIGGTEVTATVGALAVLTVVAIMSILAGRAMIRRKWSVPGWVLASLAAVFIAGGALGAAATVDSIDPVRNRFEKAQVKEFRATQKFDDVKLIGGEGVSYQQDNRYGIEIRSLGNANTDKIRAVVQDGSLVIDASELPKNCHTICLLGKDNVEIVVHKPGGFQVSDIDSDSTIQYLDNNGDLLYVDTPKEDNNPR
jgi:phage shock protein PspC (stress-responsive transcriptional regulator)